jgi:hypothetical protein
MASASRILAAFILILQKGDTLLKVIHMALFSYQVSWRSAHSSNTKVITSTIWEAAVLVLLMGEIYDVNRSVGFRKHDRHTFYDDRFRHSSNIKAIASTIWEAAALLLSTGGICEIRYWDGLGTRDRHRFMTTCLGIQVTSRLLPQQSESLQCWYYWWEKFMGYAAEIALGSVIYILDFLKIGSDVQK